MLSCRLPRCGLKITSCPDILKFIQPNLQSAPNQPVQIIASYSEFYPHHYRDDSSYILSFPDSSPLCSPQLLHPLQTPVTTPPTARQRTRNPVLPSLRLKARFRLTTPPANAPLRDSPRPRPQYHSPISNPVEGPREWSARIPTSRRCHRAQNY